MKIEEFNNLTLDEKVEWIDSMSPYVLVKHEANENVEIKKTKNGKFVFIYYAFEYCVDQVYEIKDIIMNDYHVYVIFYRLDENGEVEEVTETLKFIKRYYVRDLLNLEKQ